MTFDLSENHLKLLRAVRVEVGDPAPMVGQKRPFGNSDYYGDMLEILGVDHSPDQEYPPGWAERLDMLLDELAVAMEIVLRTGEFQAGTYRSDDYGKTWGRV